MHRALIPVPSISVSVRFCSSATRRAPLSARACARALAAHAAVSPLAPLRLCRAFSSPIMSVAASQEWLVILPDAPGMLEKRKEIRGAHLKAVSPEVSKGRVLLGGATLAKPLKDGEGPEMTGSVFIMLADSKEEVLEFLKKDIYAESAVWDLDRVQVTPFRTAVRKSLPDLGTAA